MSQSRTATIALVLTTTLTMASVVVFSSPFHEFDPEPTQKPQSPGPKAGDPIAMPDRIQAVEITLGLMDASPTPWEGSVEVSDGQVVGMEIEESGPDASVDGGHFRVRTRPEATKKKKNQNKKKQAAKNQPKNKNNAKPKAQAASVKVIPIRLLVNLDAPSDATLTVKTEQGRFEVKLSDLPASKSKTFLNGEASVEKVDPAVRLTGEPTEDAYPSITKGADGSTWLVYVSYQPDHFRLNEEVLPDQFDDLLVAEGNGDQILLRKLDGGTWRKPEEVTPMGQDVWRPTVAVNGDGQVVVAWAQQEDYNWDIYTRTFDPKAGKWSDRKRLTDDPGSDFHVVSATDSKGKVWLAWQAFRKDNYEILAGPLGERPMTVSSSPKNDWGPAIAADGKGRVFVAWDSYDAGNYDVNLRRIDVDDARPITVAGSARYEARVNLAFDSDSRLWIGYEEGEEQWGKDYANASPERVPVVNRGYPLYLHRTVRLKCLDTDDKLKEPASSLEEALAGPLPRSRSAARVAVEPSGAVWLLFRHHPLASGAGEAWHSYGLRLDEKGWSEPHHLAFSSGLLDNRPAISGEEDGLLVVNSTDRRTATANRGQADLYASKLRNVSGSGESPRLKAAAPDPEPTMAAAHPTEEADKARLRAYRVRAGGKELKLLHGDFHRHTELSAHRDQDGMLEDMWRYALDAADHDWLGNSDHHNGSGYEFMWWYVQKMADMHMNAPRFVSVHSYERSVIYPNGHRNVILPKRGIRPLPNSGKIGTEDEGSPDTKNLYAYLKHFGGICASHTSGTNMGTDWRDNDPSVEPVVEIYQGHRHNYETFGAPRSPTEATQIGGYQPKGFIWNALEKGYKLGFQSSSDHVSTHLSYAVVLAEDNSRQAIIDAFKARHSYAATDNIILDIRSGDHLMGDEFSTKEAPSIKIKAIAPKPIAKLVVVRDNKYVFTAEPGKEEVDLTFTDDDARPGESHYYYVRVELVDTNLAWASPMWIKYEK
ncbi:MAG TPA: hypothetical protein VFT74_04580 [Isosphaeraceae bacterium]|nr:hypothetical protein [Isosphaeraceae bacterium]